MPTVPCRESIPCIDPATPVTNFSTEAPDPIEFFSLRWPWVNPDNPVGGGPGGAPHVWNADGCGVECSSTQSQQAADLCAAALAEQCVLRNNGNGVFYNQQLGCSARCPDGSVFTYVAAPGLFAAASQSAANAQASAFACEALQHFMVCLPDIPTEACINAAYNATITVSRGLPPFTMTAANLPPGLSATQVSNNTLTITGTPTMPGSTNFSVTATDLFGNFMTRIYTLCVVDITPAQLPDCTIGVAYSAQLTATTCANQTQSWQVIMGSLPPGLSLDEGSGKITGTPTGPAGSVMFRVQFADQAT